MPRARALVLASVIAGCASSTREHAAAPPVDDWGAPLVALTESPLVHIRFVLYASGRVLYPDERVGTVAAYATVALTDTERAALLADLALDRVGRVDLPQREGADGGTDCITVWSRDGSHRSCSWGGFEEGPFAADDQAPTEMRAIWKRLAHFSSPRAVAWIPEAVDVSVRPWRWWNREDRCGTPPASPWPKQWPKPQPPMPLWGWRLSFPLEELSRLRALDALRMTRQGCAQPIELRGEPYELSFGMSLPHEAELWKN